MESTIKMEIIRSLYDYIMDGLKMEQLNEGIIKWDWHTVNNHFDNLVIFDNSWFIRKMINMNVKMQALEKFIKADYWNPDWEITWRNKFRIAFSSYKGTP